MNRPFRSRRLVAIPRDDEKFNMNNNDFPSLSAIQKTNKTNDQSNQMPLTYSEKLKSQQTRSVQTDFPKKNASGLIAANYSTQNHSKSKNVTTARNVHLGKNFIEEKAAKEKTFAQSRNARRSTADVDDHRPVEEGASDWIKVSKNSKHLTAHKPSKSSLNSSNGKVASNYAVQGNSSSSSESKTETMVFSKPTTENFQRPPNKDSRMRNIKTTMERAKMLSNGNRIKSDNVSGTTSTFRAHGSLHIPDEKTTKQKSIQDNPDIPETKKKKKRKSKIKRQTAFQSGKLLVLTPEVHSRILAQTRNTVSQPRPNIVFDINDCEEYPELGTAVEPRKKKEQCVRKDEELGWNDDSCDPPNPEKLKGHEVVDGVAQSVVEKESEKVSSVAKATDSEDGKSPEEKKHRGDPITMSLFDMIQTAKIKKKDTDRTIHMSEDTKPAKPVIKKLAAPAVNPLAASKPTVKRGKERENPRIKKPSRMKKLILLGRQMKKQCAVANELVNENDIPLDNQEFPKSHEDVLKDLKTFFTKMDSNVAEMTNLFHDDDCLLNDENEDKVLNFINNQCVDLQDVDETLSCVAVLFENPSSRPSSPTSFKNGNPSLTTITHKDEGNVFDANFNSTHGVDNPVDYLLKSETRPVEPIVNDNSASDHKCNLITEGEVQLESRIKVEDNLNNNSVIIDDNQNRLENNDLQPNCEDSSSPSTRYNDVLSLPECKFSDEEKKNAAKLVVHTRKFRQYCDHFLSKEIDEAVFGLIDDLARFQDRLHQRDPVKARMKKRLLYGIKEIKRHMKLKKLKCIILATDIEDIRTEGGLNDTIEELKSVAEAYHVPCIFSHHRFNLGKVCRKSVSVSCVGVFNYEGSEKNFKRMLELREDSKYDYLEFLKKLSFDLTNDQIEKLHEAEKVSANNLRAVSQDILREHYLLLLKESKFPDSNAEGNSHEIPDTHINISDGSLKENSKLPTVKCSAKTGYIAEDCREDISREKEIKICDILQKYKIIKI